MPRIKLLIVLLFFTSISFSQNSDIRILREINSKQSDNATASASLISNSVYFLSPLPSAGFYMYGTLSRNEKQRQNAILTGTSQVLAFGFAYGLKYRANRTRPYITYPDLTTTTKVNDPSFPSGHTTLAFATATCLTLNSNKWYVAVPAYAWACGVGWSRMYKGVHYPTDIMAGAIIGILVPIIIFHYKNDVIKYAQQLHLIKKPLVPTNPL